MNLRPMLWCMYAWSRPNDLQKSRRWWLNNILPFRGSLFSRLNSTMVFLILFARYAADSNAMQWWSSVQNLQSEDVIPLHRWVEAVIWYWSHSGIKSATSTRSNQDDAPCCVSFDILPPGRSMKAISGVLKSPWAALSIGRMISLIGRLLLADRLGQRGG